MTIKNPYKRSKIIKYYSHPRERRSIKLQCGNASLGKHAKTTTRSASKHTPTKKKPHFTKFYHPQNFESRIHNLPGRKSKSAESAPSKYEICGSVFDSFTEKQMQKFKRHCWIACDTCGEYWGHAFCFNIKAPKGKKLEDVTFFYPKHDGNN